MDLVISYITAAFAILVRLLVSHPVPVGILLLFLLTLGWFMFAPDRPLPVEDRIEPSFDE